MIPKKMGKFQLKMKMWSKLNGNVCPKMIPFFPSNGKGDGGHCVCNNLCFFHQTDASWVALKLNGRMGLSATPAAVSPNHSAVWGVARYFNGKYSSHLIYAIAQGLKRMAYCSTANGNCLFVSSYFEIFMIMLM